MKITTDIKLASQTIKEGGVILCPTDTIWGLSADARNQAAVNQVFELKNRPDTKSMIVLVSSIEMLKTYVVEPSSAALDLIRTASKPTTIIYPRGKNLAKNTLANNGSVAIRVVQDAFCKQLIDLLGFPIISTSANLSGEPNASYFDEIDVSLKEGVDYVVQHAQDLKEPTSPSSIYILEGTGFRQIR